MDKTFEGPMDYQKLTSVSNIKRVIFFLTFLYLKKHVITSE